MVVLNDLDERLERRRQEIVAGLAKLDEDELMRMKTVAYSMDEGGAMLQGALRSKCAGLKLAYNSSGRLRSDIYKMIHEGRLPLA